MAISDEELVERVRNGDQGASRELVERYRSKALALAFSMTGGDRGEAEDLTQEAFLKVFRGLNGFKGRSSFHTWFHRVLVNTCLDGLRRKRRRERFLSLWPLRPRENGPSLEEAEVGSDPGRESDPLQVLRAGEFRRQVGRVLARLPRRQRAAFHLKVFQDLTIREIAEIMGLAEGTVKSHLFRATRALREGLAEWAET